MSTKDLFSSHARLYAAFRPTYPPELYNFIFQHVKEFSCAWDCATGNGQAAQYLCNHFENVYATDISAQQLQEAYKTSNIHYEVSAGEKTSFADNMFDLITVGQALHWFDVDRFYSEAKRVSKPGGIIATWGYTIPSVSAEVDTHLLHFYKAVVGHYWDASRKLVDDEYRSIPFPFEEIPSPKFHINLQWNRDTFAGYIESWSATQHYIRKNNRNPVVDLIKEISNFWTAREMKRISFPVFLRLGKINHQRL